MRKAISLFLVFSILALSVPLTAKEREGADLIIQRTDGTQVRGELIAVKQNSLLVLDRYSGAGVTIEIRDIGKIKIERKSLVREGAIIGFLIGGGIGVLIGLKEAAKEENEIFWFGWLSQFRFVLYGLLLGLAGVIIGGFSGKLVGADTIIRFEGKSDSEIKEILEKLRKKARVKNAQ